MFFFLNLKLVSFLTGKAKHLPNSLKIKNTTHFVSLTCRDGVSEGQFSQVLLYEVDAIRKVFFCLCYPFLYVFTFEVSCPFYVILLIFVFLHSGVC